MPEKQKLHGSMRKHNRWISGLKLVMELSKIRITVAVSLTTMTGYVLAGRSFDAGFLMPALGIFLLACGASVLNHIQERRTDALMDRTMGRPMPSQRISMSFAIILAVLEIGIASVILILCAEPIVLLLGYLALIWYNILYINLKKITPHAVIPGSLVGLIPPLMGWIAAGGIFWDMHVLQISVFFFIWQVPHFYLLSLKYGNQYEMAGFPTLQQKMTVSGIHKMIWIWILLTALSGPLLLLGGLLRSLPSIVLIPLISLWLLFIFRKFPGKHATSTDYSRYFMRINFYFLACVLLMITDPFWERLLIS